MEEIKTVQDPGVWEIRHLGGNSYCYEEKKVL
jgi:hypothetical protein